MPRAKAARDEDPRLEKVLELSLKMEEPINEAIHLVRALGLMGYGMGGRVPEDDGQSVSTVAFAARDRLEDLQGTCERLFRAARQPRRGRDR